MNIFKTVCVFVFFYSSSAIAQEIYEGPIIDGHLHLFAKTDVNLVRKTFKENNVLKAVWFPRHFKSQVSKGISEEAADEFISANRDLGYFTVGLQRKLLSSLKQAPERWAKTDGKWKKFIKGARKKIRNGERDGLGELIVRHYSYNFGKGEYDYPIDSPLFTSLIRASDELAVPLIVHAEGEDHVVSSLLEKLPKFQNAKLVWAHACGRSDPIKIREWIKSNSNLFCDLGNMTDTGNYGSLWPRAGSWTYQFEKNGKILPEWKALVEDYPNRFYIGSDVNEEQGWGSQFKKSMWLKRIKRFRVLLGQLSPNAQEWLAWKTVETLYK